MKRLLLIRQTSPQRQIAESELLDALSDAEQRLERDHLEIPMSQFADSVEQGDWRGQDLFLREQAATIRKKANEGDVTLHYFCGFAEVPQIVAIGAHIGDEHVVVVHDQDRDRAEGKWAWPANEQNISLMTTGEADLSAMVKASGPVVIRIALSAAIADGDVRQAIGDETLADVTITHKDSTGPAVGRIRSAADVTAVRQEFRRIFALVRNMRPNADQIHLFVAAPPSVCFVVGQELTLRNSPPVQLYRYRKSTDRASQQPAILLTAAGEEAIQLPLTEEEIRTAAHIRNNVWPSALEDLKNYVKNRRRMYVSGKPWFDGMEPPELPATRPFPALTPLVEVLPTDATVDPEPIQVEFGFEKTTRRWRLADRTLLGLNRAVDGNEQRLRELIRLFLCHEYLHEYQTITKHTAREVGKFATCLEYLDYTADSYAMLHQFDLVRFQDSSLLDDPGRGKQFFRDQVELAIKSFWAFDEDTRTQWQVRRIRRYLNWYWRLVQIENAPDLKTTVLLFRRQPHLEIGGLHQVARSRRVIAFLDRLDDATNLELGIVLENDRLHRVSSSVNTNLPELLRAFVHADHSAIKEFFRSVFDTAPLDGRLPNPQVELRS
jgi:hypothetical protein